MNPDHEPRERRCLASNNEMQPHDGSQKKDSENKSARKVAVTRAAKNCGKNGASSFGEVRPACGYSI
jgi:hypothetical protein